MRVGSFEQEFEHRSYVCANKLISRKGSKNNNAEKLRSAHLLSWIESNHGNEGDKMMFGTDNRKLNCIGAQVP